ncbi:MAG: hypothetical protein AAFR35_13255 [Pseudomonadota bacterium]
MSTWTSSAPLLFAIGLLGCGPGVDVGLGSAGASFTRSVPDRITVAGDSVVVAGPPGYCVDTSLTRDRGADAFVLLGSCAALARDDGADRPDLPAILTVSISEVLESAQAMSLDDLEAFAVSPTGRAAFSRDGTEANVTIDTVFVEKGTLVLQVTDTGGRDTSPLGDTYWRSIFIADGRVISAAVVGHVDHPLGADAGLDTLRTFTAQLIDENGATRSSEEAPV